MWPASWQAISRISDMVKQIGFFWGKPRVATQVGGTGLTRRRCRSSGMRSKRGLSADGPGSVRQRPAKLRSREFKKRCDVVVVGSVKRVQIPLPDIPFGLKVAATPRKTSAALLDDQQVPSQS